MAKKIYAVTNIKMDSGPDGVIAAGDEIDQAKSGLSKKQLLELHEAGAIEVRDDAPAKEAVAAPEDTGVQVPTPNPEDEDA